MIAYSIHACVHGDARAMWDARTDHARAMESRRPVLVSTVPGAKDQERLAMQDACTKNKVHRKPRARDQGPRAKEQEARTKSQRPRLCHAWTHSQVYHIYIYGSLRDSNFPGSRVPHAIPDFQAPGISTLRWLKQQQLLP